jgi:hypothetical protein
VEKLKRKRVVNNWIKWEIDRLKLLRCYNATPTGDVMGYRPTAQYVEKRGDVDAGDCRKIR